MSDSPKLASSVENPSSGYRFLRSYLSRFIITAGVVWVVYIFWKEFPNLRDNLKIDSWPWLGYTLVAGAAAQMLLVPVFQLILRHTGGVFTGYWYAGRLLFVAQILRHLPGRLWGIVYLVKETRESIPPAAMIRANLEVMVYSMAFSLIVAGTLALGVIAGIPVAVVFLVASIVSVAISIRSDLTGLLLRSIVRLVPSKAAQYEEALKLHESLPWKLILSIIGYFVLAWCLYISIWWAIPKVFHSLQGVNIWLLCASYSAAWVIGYLTMITPGGLGVREAGFIAMSTRLTTLPNLAFLAVFVRLWQIFIELTLFLAFAFAKRDSDAGKVVTTTIKAGSS
jgi:uncharacterized membrane protein YbhN (UPF0104 family)